MLSTKDIVFGHFLIKNKKINCNIKVVGLRWRLMTTYNMFVRFRYFMCFPSFNWDEKAKQLKQFEHEVA